MAKVKGLPKTKRVKISYLQDAFKLSAEDALALKKGQEIEIDDADGLLKANFVSAVDKPKSIKVKVEKPKTNFNEIATDVDEIINSIVTDEGEEE